MRMKKIELALAGGLLLTPMIASAQQAKTNQTGNALPPITVVTGKSAKAGKANKPAKTGTAQKAASSSAADASASGSGGGAGEGAAAQGGDTALPPSVTSQVAGTVVVTEADLGRVSSVTREGLNLMGGAAQTSFYQAADIVPSIIVASPDPYGLSPTRNINIAGKSDFHLARNINGLPIFGDCRRRRSLRPRKHRASRRLPGSNSGR